MHRSNTLVANSEKIICCWKRVFGPLDGNNVTTCSAQGNKTWHNVNQLSDWRDVVCVAASYFALRSSVSQGVSPLIGLQNYLHNSPEIGRKVSGSTLFLATGSLMESFCCVTFK